MRRVLIAAGLTAAVLSQAGPAAAAEGTWCLRASVGRGTVTEICHFRSFEACRDERSLWGSSASCTQNPRYLPYWQGRGFGEEPPRKFTRKTKKRRH
jgi:hypothetical protein